MAAGARVAVDVVRQAGPWRQLKGATVIARRSARHAVDHARRHAGTRVASGAEMAITLADDATVRAANLAWRGLDKPTNVLSFPAANPGKLATAPMLGDVIIAFETLAREAEDEGKAIGDHFIHLVVHGTLHLLGFDHVVPAEAEQMEALETAILAELGVADPYADTEVVEEQEQ
jgi:probable rRNA maturation factor